MKTSDVIKTVSWVLGGTLTARSQVMGAHTTWSEVFSPVNVFQTLGTACGILVVYWSQSPVKPAGNHDEPKTTNLSETTETDPPSQTSPENPNRPCQKQGG